MALPSDWARFLAAIRAQESGGNYTQNSAGCLGAYCWNDQGSWDRMAQAAGIHQYAGVNPSQVPSQVQDQVASSNLSHIYQQAGGGSKGLRDAAMWWNGGSTSSEANPGLPAQPWAKNCGGGSSAAYACQVLARMGLGGHYLAGAGSGAGGTVGTQPKGAADCLVSIPGIPGTSIINDIFGSGGNVGGFCLLTRSQARAVYAVALIGAGSILMLAGLAFVGVFTVGPGRVLLNVGRQFRGQVQSNAGTRITAQEKQLDARDKTAAAAAARQQQAAARTQERVQQRAKAKAQGQDVKQSEATTELVE